MTQDKQQAVFTANLNRIMAERGCRQLDLARAIQVSPQTINTWTQGKAIPRMDKMERIANYFGILKSDLVDEHVAGRTEALIRAFDARPEMRTLFSIAESATKEDIEQAIKIIEALKK